MAFNFIKANNNLTHTQIEKLNQQFIFKQHNFSIVKIKNR